MTPYAEWAAKIEAQETVPEVEALRPRIRDDAELGFQSQLLLWAACDARARALASPPVRSPPSGGPPGPTALATDIDSSTNSSEGARAGLFPSPPSPDNPPAVTRESGERGGCPWCGAPIEGGHSGMYCTVCGWSSLPSDPGRGARAETGAGARSGGRDVETAGGRDDSLTPAGVLIRGESEAGSQVGPPAAAQSPPHTLPDVKWGKEAYQISQSPDSVFPDQYYPAPGENMNPTETEKAKAGTQEHGLIVGAGEVLRQMEERAAAEGMEMPRFHADAIAAILEDRKALRQVLREKLISGVDYGTIPGIQGEMLFEAGADTFLPMYHCRARPAKTEVRWELGEDEDHFSVISECEIISWDTGRVVAGGVGAASTHETKYAYRWVTEADVPKELKREDLKTKTWDSKVKYRVPNPEIGELLNTIVKMGFKRAKLDAVQALPGVAGLFKGK